MWLPVAPRSGAGPCPIVQDRLCSRPGLACGLGAPEVQRGRPCPRAVGAHSWPPGPGPWLAQRGCLSWGWAEVTAWAGGGLRCAGCQSCLEPSESSLASGASQVSGLRGFTGATCLASRSRHWRWGALGQGEVKGERVADTNPPGFPAARGLVAAGSGDGCVGQCG